MLLDVRISRFFAYNSDCDPCAYGHRLKYSRAAKLVAKQLHAMLAGTSHVCTVHARPRASCCCHVRYNLIVCR